MNCESLSVYELKKNLLKYGGFLFFVILLLFLLFCVLIVLYSCVGFVCNVSGLDGIVVPFITLLLYIPILCFVFIE